MRREKLNDDVPWGSLSPRSRKSRATLLPESVPSQAGRDLVALPGAAFRCRKAYPWAQWLPAAQADPEVAETRRLCVHHTARSWAASPYVKGETGGRDPPVLWEEEDKLTTGGEGT